MFRKGLERVNREHHQQGSDKGKPGESRRRKAMGRPSDDDEDRQAAEDHE